MLVFSRMGENGHWYEHSTGKAILVTGVPYAASNKAKAGQLKAPTLREARQYGFAPSTTTIIQILDKPGLRTWALKHAVETAMRSMRAPGETLEEHGKRIIQAHEEYAEEAAERGTAIHLGLQRTLSGQALPFEELGGDLDVVTEFMPWYQEQGFVCEHSEQSFYSDLGWAGTIDWRGTRYGHKAAADFKTQEFNNVKDAKFYDEHALQLASYDIGVNGVDADSDRYSIILSRSVPGLVALHRWEDNARWNRKWLKLWEFWQEMKEWSSRPSMQQQTPTTLSMNPLSLGLSNTPDF